MGPSSILSAVRDRLTATASAAAERLAGALPGSPGAGGATGAGGISTTTVACPSLVAGEWVAIALHHQVRETLAGGAASMTVTLTPPSFFLQRRRGGLLGGGQEHHELSVSVDGHEVARAIPCAFPRSLGAAPLVLARIGEALFGEVGPIYFFGEGCGPLPAALQAAFERVHTGGTVLLVPTTVTTSSPENPLSKAFAAYHPAYCRVEEGAGEAHGTSSSPLFFCPSLLGAAPSYISGHHAVRPIAGVGIRDALHAVGGVFRMLPLARGAMAVELAASARHVYQYPREFRSALSDVGTVAPQAGVAELVDCGVQQPLRSIVSQVLEACAALLRDHVSNCQQALHNAFFAALRFEIAPHLRPTATTSPLQSSQTGSTSVAAYDDETVVSAALALASAAATLPELKIDAWKSLLCWAPLYAHTSSSVQHHLFHQLRRVARAQPTLFRTEVGIGFLVDALKVWYTAVSSPPTVDHGGAPSMPDGPAATAAAASAAASATAGEPALGDSPALPYAVRHELLREFLRFLGCAILAAPAVLHPSEVQVGGTYHSLEEFYTSIDVPPPIVISYSLAG